MDPHKILGIGRNATLAEIQRAYRQKAAKHHPDRGGDAWAFEQVREAYEQLLKSRQTASLHASMGPSTANPSPYRQPGRPPRQAKGWPPGAGAEARDPVPQRSRLGRTIRQAWRRVGPPLWQFAFRQLPLQNETATFILVNVLDLYVTYLVIRSGGVEVNPVARFFVDRWGIEGLIAFKMGSVALVAVVAQMIAHRNLRTARLLLRFGILLVGIVVIYGITLLVGHIRGG